MNADPLSICLVVILGIVAGGIFYTQEKCPSGGFHRWKKTGSKWTPGNSARQQICSKCGKTMVPLSMSH